jgi:hypothetical protein
VGIRDAVEVEDDVEDVEGAAGSLMIVVLPQPASSMAAATATSPKGFIVFPFV